MKVLMWEGSGWESSLRKGSFGECSVQEGS